MTTVRTKLWLFGLTVVLIGALLPGCTSGADAKPTGKYQIVRKAVLEGRWQMYQFRLDLESGSEFDIDLLDLVEGDKVDGYFYPEKGSGASLTIKAGASTIYQSAAPGGAGATTVSGRFSFVANQPQGTAYVLLFSNAGTEKVETVFLELIYPTTGAIRGPIDLK